MDNKYVKKTISIDRPLAGAISAYASACDMDTSKAIRTLCTIGLAVRPEAVYTDEGGELTGREIVTQIGNNITNVERRLDDMENYLAGLIQAQGEK